MYQKEDKGTSLGCGSHISRRGWEHHVDGRSWPQDCTGAMPTIKAYSSGLLQQEK